jgi:hypothetical protein
MRRWLTLFTVALLFALTCGAPPEETEKTTSEKSGHEVAFESLTETELQKFIKVFPVFKAEAEKMERDWEPSEDVGSWLQAFSERHKDIAELDAKLTAAGMSWNDFWPAYAKTTTAVAAVMFDSAMVEFKKEIEGQEGEAAELEAKLKDPNVSAQEKEMIRNALEMMKSAQQAVTESGEMYEAVPQTNKNLVKKYMNQLVEIFEIEE